MHHCHNRWSIVGQPHLQRHYEEEDHIDGGCLPLGRKHVDKNPGPSYFGILGLRESHRRSQQFFSLVIISTIGKFDVSLILIIDDILCDIIYSEVPEKIRLGQRSLLPYKGSDLQAFNKTTTHPGGYMKLIVSVGNPLQSC